MIEKGNRLINTVVNLCFAILSVWILCAKIRAYFSQTGDHLLLQIASIVIAVILFLVFWIKLQPSKLMIKINSLSNLSIGLFIIIFSLASKTAILFIFEIDSSNHSDIMYYYDFIKQLTAYGKIVEPGATVGGWIPQGSTLYAARYWYTVLYSLLFLPASKLFGCDNILVFNGYLIVLHTIAAILLYDTLQFNFTKAKALLAVMLWMVLPVGMTLQQVLIHENALIFFHILAIWLIFRIYKNNKGNFKGSLALFLGITIMIAIAQVNKFAYIGLIALLIVMLSRLLDKNSLHNRRERIKPIAIYTITIIAMIPLVLGISSALKERMVDEKNDLTNQIPLGWNLYVGLNSESDGTFRTDDYNTYYKYLEYDDLAEQRVYQKQLVKDRLNSLLGKPINFLKLLNNKIKIIWGSFYDILGYKWGNANNDALFSTKTGGLIYRGILIIHYVVQIVISLIIVFSSFLPNDEGSNYIQYIKLFILGCTFILLFVEVAPKYAVHMDVLYITIFAAKVDSVVKYIKGKLNRVKTKKGEVSI